MSEQGIKDRCRVSLAAILRRLMAVETAKRTDNLAANNVETLMKNLRKLKMVSVICLLFGVIGCMSDEANRYYLEERLPAKTIDEVEVLRTEPQQAYTVIADFQANNASIKHMRKRAAKLGADAVIVVPAGGKYSQKEVWAATDRYSNTYSRLLGTAIIYRTEK